MARDLKYGKFTTEFGTIGEDEPVFVFRARDKLLPKVLAYYHLFCMKEGSGRDHLSLILDAKSLVDHWQREHETKRPDSVSFVNKKHAPKDQS